jgi:DNA repair exonuclease SbcCD nuclease subunit
MEFTNAIYVYVLGNHDMSKPSDAKYHALRSMVGLHPGRFIIVDKRMDIGNITLVPYMHNHQDFPKDTKEIVIAHQTFVGADYGYTRPEVGVDAGLVSAELIISGHIHKRQNFGKVYYPGTPFAADAKDMDQIKGVMVLDTDTYNQVFIPSPFPLWRHLAFTLSPEVTIADVHTGLVTALNNKDHWVLDLTGTKSEIMGYLNSNKYRDAVEGCDIKPNHTFTDKDKRKVKIQSLSMETIFNEYIDKVYSGNLSKDQLKGMALGFLKEARQANSKQKM